MTAAWRYEISLLVLKKYFTCSLRALVKYFSTLEEKFRISVRPCNILYLLLTAIFSSFWFFTCFYRLRKQTRGKFIEFDLSFVVSVFTDITERVKMNMQWCPSCFSSQDLQQLPTGCTETFFKIFLSFPRAAILTVAYIVYLRSVFDLWVLSFN